MPREREERVEISLEEVPAEEGVETEGRGYGKEGTIQICVRPWTFLVDADTRCVTFTTSTPVRLIFEGRCPFEDQVVEFDESVTLEVYATPPEGEEGLHHYTIDFRGRRIVLDPDYEWRIGPGGVF